MNRLQAELKQRRPFESLEQEVLLNLARTASVLMHRLDQALKPHGLTTTQFNVLRIVRGAGPEGIAQCDIADRMVTATPDIPRLLRRLQTAHLIARAVHPTDRRVQTVLLTPAGSDLLHTLDTVVPAASRALLARLTPAQLTTLNHLLDTLR